MGATYTRQSTISDGAVIEASHFNDEFDQILAAFAASTGHTHDGTAAEGGPIAKLLNNTLTFGAGTSGTDITITFDGETSDGVMYWMEDEDHFKFADDVVMDSSKRLYLYDEGGEYIYGDGTDLYLTSGADINIPANIGMTFGNDGEKIEGDGTDLTITGNNIKLTATADVVIPADVGITFGTGEKIEGNSTDLTVTSGADINLTATSDVNIPSDVGITFGDDGEKIEGDGTNLTVSTSNNITVDAAGDIILDADGGDVFFKDGGTTFGSATNTSGNLIIKSGTTTALTFSGANATLAGDLTISGDDLTMGTNTSGAVLVADGTNFNPVVISGDISIGTTGTAAIGSGVIVNADVNASAAIADSKLATISTADKVAGGAIQIDSGTDGTSITLADTDKFLVDDGGTTKYINASQLNTYTSSSVAADDIGTGDGAVTLATSSGSITIDAQAGDADIIFKGTDSSSDITALTLDMSEAGAATFNDKIVATELDISGNMDIDGTSNLDAVDIDGAVQIDNTITVGVDDTGYDVKFFGDTASAYMLWDTSADDLVLAGAAGIDLAGNIDVDGTSNLDNTDIDGTLAVDGTTISLDATTSLNIDNSNTSNGITIGTATSGVPISIGHSTSETTINDNLTITGNFTVNGTTTTVNSTTVTVDDPIFTLGGDSAPGSDDNKDRGIEFRYHDGSSARVGFFGYDDSATGFTFLTAATNSSEVFSGTAAKIIAGELDISGNMDIDGTSNLDAVDIDGAVQIDNTVTVGVDDTGYDVKFFGDTASAYMLWDTSTDDLVLAGAANLYLYDAGGGEKLSSDGTDLTINSGADINLTATSDVNIPSGVGVTFGNDGEKIEGDGTDLTISGNTINLTATTDVALAVNTGLLFAGTEKIESDGTDLSITVGSGGDINIGSDIGVTFGDDGEKIEGDGTDLTITSSGVLNFAAGGTTNQIKVTDGAILPITDDDVDLGSASYQFKNAYFDGTLEADAITIGGSAITAGGATQGFAIAMSVAL